MAGKKEGAPKRRPSGPSGPSQTDEQRSDRGIGRITLRMPQDALDMLTAASQRSGRSRAETIENLIRRHLR